ncbi:hypothetical protein [Sporosarcina phage Lietuvens]|nr:hypothetical protein [Sporosarcina phage Lietuvens]
MDEVRRLELLRLMDEQRGEILYDIARAKVGLARMEKALLDVQDAIQDLIDEKGTIE